MGQLTSLPFFGQPHSASASVPLFSTFPPAPLFPYALICPSVDPVVGLAPPSPVLVACYPSLGLVLKAMAASGVRRLQITVDWSSNIPRLEDRNFFITSLMVPVKSHYDTHSSYLQSARNELRI
jgi:hypothetical protein